MNHLDDSANKACFQYFFQKKQTKDGRSMPTALSRMEKKRRLQQLELDVKQAIFEEEERRQQRKELLEGDFAILAK